VDAKFEFGVAHALDGGQELIYMDEVGTPDSSRIWRRSDWENGEPKEHSKEQFREALLSWVSDRDLLLNPERMIERGAYASTNRVPDEFFTALSYTYAQQAKRILGKAIPAIEHPREMILDLLNEQFGLVI